MLIFIKFGLKITNGNIKTNLPPNVALASMLIIYMDALDPMLTVLFVKNCCSNA